MDLFTIYLHPLVRPDYSPPLTSLEHIHPIDDCPSLFTTRLPDKKPRPFSGGFAAALAHEVRNPLANINMAIEMLQAAMQDEEHKTYLDIIMRSSIRINTLLSELLQNQETATVTDEKHSMQQLLDEVLDMADDRLCLKHIALTKNYTDDCTIVMDRPKIKIALTNIIVNAIDAMNPKNGTLGISTTFIDGKYAILVQDNGCGISKGNLEYIFKPYFTNKPGGMGLGLATTYAILRSGNVEMRVASEEGVGTVFTLLFETSNDYNPFNN